MYRIKYELLLSWSKCTFFIFTVTKHKYIYFVFLRTDCHYQNCSRNHYSMIFQTKILFSSVTLLNYYIYWITHKVKAGYVPNTSFCITDFTARHLTILPMCNPRDKQVTFVSAKNTHLCRQFFASALQSGQVP